MNSKLYRWLTTQMTNLIEIGQYAYGAKDKIEKLPIPKLDSKENQKIAEKITTLVERF